MTKKEMRALAKARLEAISPAQYKAMGKAMLATLRQMPQYQNAKTIFCYVGAKNEPDTLPILKQIVADQKVLCVPKLVSSREMLCMAIPDFSSLMPAGYGLLEPLAGHPVPPQQVDLAIVPCLACDKTGHRLGHGGGYYDVFMAKYHGQSLILCPSAAVLDEVPLEPHDLPCQLILTEEGIIDPAQQ